MRVVGSSLVSPGEIPVHLHPMSDADAACCCCCVLLQEPAHFYWIKPPSLSVRVSDDHWASLKLRVDPLARKILDPTRSLLVAAFLIFLFWQVFRAIKPNPDALVFDASSYLDMDDYTDDNSKRLLEQQQQHQQDHQHNNGKEEEHQQQLEYYKQQQLNLYLARKASMEHSLLYWNIGFFTFVFFLMLTTAYLSKGMMDNNACVDELIRKILKEIRQRFQLECGFDISYRTNQRDTRWQQYSSTQQQQQPTDDKRIVLVPPTTNPWNVVLWNSFQNIIFRPQRVIVFTDLFAKTEDLATDDILSPTFSSVASSSSPGDNNTRNNNNTFLLYDTSTTRNLDGNNMMNNSSLFPTNSNTNYHPPSSIMDRLPSFSMT